MPKRFQVDSGGTLTTSLLSYYQLESNSNDFFDSTNGTDTSVTYSAGNGKVNNGAGYNGTSSKNVFGTGSFNFERTDSFSVSFWFKSSVQTQYILGKSKDTIPVANAGWAICTQSGGNGAFYFNLASGINRIQVNTYPNTFIDGAWYHVVVTYAGTSLASGCKIYVNNTSQTLTVDVNNLANSILNSDAFQIGKAVTDSNFLSGSLDEIGIWSKVLTTTEVSDLYNGGSGQTMVSAAAKTPTLLTLKVG